MVSSTSLMKAFLKRGPSIKTLTGTNIHERAPPGSLSLSLSLPGWLPGFLAAYAYEILVKAFLKRDPSTKTLTGTKKNKQSAQTGAETLTGTKKNK